MKQLLFVFSFVLVAAMSANAQTCNKTASSGKACCAAKKSAQASATSSTDTKVASVMMEADIAASKDENIQKRTCEVSGTTSYYQKSVCAHSGTVSWDEVEYDSNAQKFTKVASASMEKDENGNKVTKKACAANKACCKAKAQAN